MQPLRPTWLRAVCGSWTSGMRPSSQPEMGMGIKSIRRRCSEEAFDPGLGFRLLRPVPGKQGRLSAILDPASFPPLFLVLQWEPQHQGLTCDEFQEWKRANDPEYQAQGLAAYLQENGIGEYSPPPPLPPHLTEIPTRTSFPSKTEPWPASRMVKPQNS